MVQYSHMLFLNIPRDIADATPSPRTIMVHGTMPPLQQPCEVFDGTKASPPQSPGTQTLA